MTPINADCPYCASPLPAEARFCPGCGMRTSEQPRAFAYDSVEPRYFGVTPATSLLVLGIASLALGIVLLAAGYWLAGGLIAGGGLVLFGASLGVARRKPDGFLARLALAAEDGLRSRASLAAGLLAARSAAQLEVLRLRARAARLQAARANALLELGHATHAGDEEWAQRVRDQLTGLDQELAAGELLLAEAIAEAEARISQARLETQSTAMLEPEPPQIPEPTPEPHVPPTPPQIPEPTPEPHVPPVPPQVPEPTPVPDPGLPAGRTRVYTR